MSNSPQWVLEWSQQQNAFHIQLLNDMLESNIKCIRANKRQQYMALFVGTYDECSSAANELRAYVKVRELFNT